MNSYKDFLRVTTTKFVRGISSLMFFLAKLLLPLKNRKKKDKPEDDAEAEASPEAPIMFVRSRLDGDIESFSVKKKKPKELIGPDSKQRLTRTLSGKIAYSTGVSQYACSVRILNLKRDRTKSAPAK